MVIDALNHLERKVCGIPSRDPYLECNALDAAKVVDLTQSRGWKTRLRDTSFERHSPTCSTAISGHDLSERLPSSPHSLHEYLLASGGPENMSPRKWRASGLQAVKSNRKLGDNASRGVSPFAEAHPPETIPIMLSLEMENKSGVHFHTCIAS